MSVHSRTLAAVAVLLLVLPSTPAAVGSDGGALADETARFTDITREAGFPDDLARSRVAWGDYDGDGWEDLLLDGRQLWRNLDGSGRFSDVTSGAGIGGVPGVGGVWADYDNDGDLDFYTIVRSTTARDALWRNDGDGTFTDVTMMSGEVYDHLPSEGAAWGDWDNDGFVDLYVANYETASVNPDDELGIGTPDVFYWNQGDGTFVNATRELNLELDGEPLCGRGVVWADYDDDGDMDIYVSNYRLDPNLLWVNLGEAGFSNWAAYARAEGYSSGDLPGSPRYGHTIGSDFGDYDNDGDMDLFASNLAHPRFIMFSDKSMLLNNQGDGTFLERFYGSGIDYCETSSDPSWADYDNDGDLDLYFTAVYEGAGSRLFRNTDRDRFEDVTEESRTSVDNGWGTGWCDYDHDGDLDLAVGSGTSFRLLENEGNDNHWLEVELEGSVANSKAIGARVRVSAGGVEMVRDVKGGRGTTSQDMLACHFGLGSYDGEVDVEVRWPGDREWSVFGGYSADQRVHISQAEGNNDLAVHVEVYPESPEVGEAVEVYYSVENVGDSTFSTFDVSVFVQGTRLVTTRFDGSLDPGHIMDFDALWQPTREGDHTMECRLMDSSPEDTDPDNDVAQLVVTVRGQNIEPVARLRVSPNAGPPNGTFTFDGSDSYDDTSVALYHFDFGDDTSTGWQSSPVATHVYTVEGQYLASLTVQDVDGLSSTNFANVQVNVSSMGYRPTAEIITILPSPAHLGEVVTLHGGGFAVGDATITGYLWTSSINGRLGGEALITTSQLSLGEHTIFLKVQDSRGLWSDPVSTLLEVLPPQGTWTVRIDEPREGAKAGGDALRVAGTARYSTGPVQLVEVRVDNGPWEEATGTEDWWYDVDLLDLTDGPHTIRVRASALGSVSDTAMVNFTLGEPIPEPFTIVGWLTSWRGIIFVIAVAALIVANVHVSRRRHRLMGA